MERTLEQELKMSRLSKSAKGKMCQVRIPSVCRNETDTVCLAHIGGAGWAMKTLDIHGAYYCGKCHDIVDGRVKSEFPHELIKLWHLQGVMRTQEIMVKEKLIRF